ncbi:sodium:calcium antiporter [Haloarcula onubensis]|uniref:Sodium/calcium exchanger membrane region domain-containing protein n=1 Tax=Haloarcula onubensis TaxID=2950539 RepID=A0ABU2FQ67_9EURY|nr:hypothetical protein [Halomicroarcula sp. S3CR25-11]MDS0282899.1 hypothetical protein [Halomicroarcula sp. S3CR25-11]
MSLSPVVAQSAIGLGSAACLLLAAQLVVRKAVRLAKFYGLSEAVLGLTVVSLGTSLPEIASHVVASGQILLGVGDPRVLSATVLGANIGSDVVQQTLVLGIVVIAVGGFQFSPAFLRRGYAPMIGTTLLTLLLAWDGLLSRLDGVVLLSVFAAYTYYLFTTRSEILQAQGPGRPSERPRRDLLVALVALAVVVLSAHVLFQAVDVVVGRTGLAGSMVGVVVLGVGAASPELTTALVGLREGAEGLSLGTLIGSNITNPLLGIGLGSLLSTYHVPAPLVYWDLPVETATAALLLTYLLTKDDVGRCVAELSGRLRLDSVRTRFLAVEERRLGRVGAALLIALYFLYLYVRLTRFGEDFPGGAAAVFV